MAGRFTIEAFPRTGSYHLVSLLDSAPDVVCYGELFKVERVELAGALKAAVGAETVEQRNADAAGFLRRLAALRPDKIFGFKVFAPAHLQGVPGLAAELASAEWKAVILCRDPVETYASMLRAKATRVWTLQPKRNGSRPSNEVLNRKVAFSPRSLRNFARRYNGFLEHAHDRARGGERCFILHYGQVGEPAVMSRLLAFLGSSADPASLRSAYAKQFSHPLAEGFTNWDELRAFLATDWPFMTLPPPTVGAGRPVSAIRG